MSALQVCSREEGEGALQSVMQKALDKGATEDVAKQQVTPEVSSPIIVPTLSLMLILTACKLFPPSFLLKHEGKPKTSCCCVLQA